MGKVILIGGNVEKGLPTAKIGKAWLKKTEPEILEKLLSEMKGKKSRIEIITSASKIQHKMGQEYINALANLNCNDVGLMHFKSKREADKKDFIERLNVCDGIMFSGGDQVLLCKRLLGTKLLDVIKTRFKNEPDFLISGTSAGAMALAETMIARGIPSEALSKGHVTLSQGLGILPEIIVDTHFIQRGRFSRLIEATAKHPSKLGIGLGENTAVFFHKPEMVETIGSNLVALIDSSQLSYNNINYISNDDEICVQDIKLHILPKHHKFNIIKKKIYNNKIKEKLKRKN